MSVLRAHICGKCPSISTGLVTLTDPYDAVTVSSPAAGLGQLAIIQVMAIIHYGLTVGLISQTHSIIEMNNAAGPGH